MKSRPIHYRGLAVAAAVLLVAAPVATPDANALTAAPPDWGACPDDIGPGAELMQCATVEVPLDYADPGGTKIDIAISRLVSTDPDERRGVLLTNPGGPGGSGLSFPTELVDLGLPASVRDRYDIIGMDPRGIGRSAPVSCGFTTEQGYNSNLPPYSHTDEDVAQQAVVVEGVAEQCAEHDTAGTLRYMSTVNTARDMDMVRTALGEERVSYYGISYGTVLGSAYASMFPDRTDRVVLDSNLGETALDMSGFRRFGLGMEQRFPDFAKYAAARHATYELGRTPREVRRNYFALADRLDKSPVDGVDGELFRFNVFALLYFDQDFPLLAQFWQSLDRADSAAVRELRDRVTQRAALTGAAAEPHPFDNGISGQIAIICNDSAWAGDVATYQRNTAADRVRYPLYGGAAANITPCAYWPEPLEPRAPISPDGPSNILLLQNLRDPATPYIGGVEARQQFGDRARLVSIDQGGHGAYLFADNPCGLNTTTAYLVHGTLPAADVFCQASPRSGLNLDAPAAARRAATLERLRH